MKLGLIAFATNNGLGNQTKALYDHLKPAKTMVVDISELNKQKVFKSRYKNAQWVKGIPRDKDFEQFLEGLDTVFVCETPLNYNLFSIARRKKVKTILQYNFEFLDYLNNQKIPLPDILVSPSAWYFKVVKEKFGDKCPVIFLPFPIDTKKLKVRKVTTIKTFVHISGQKLHEDRNGTEIVLSAIPKVKNPDARFIIYSQHPLNVTITDPRVQIRETNVNDYASLYKEGDVLLLPRRYGGQSLQLNEAMGSGMIPVMLDCPPNDQMLPKDLLIPSILKKETMTRVKIPVFDEQEGKLAEKIDEMMGWDVVKVSDHTKAVQAYARATSWEVMKDAYLTLCT